MSGNGELAGLPTDASVASMGPRLFSRGNTARHSRSGRIPKLQWGRDFSVAEIDTRRASSDGCGTCFNGAATFQSRKYERLCQRRNPDGLLQWGRDFSVAEMQRQRHGRLMARIASMGPRLFSRGNRASEAAIKFSTELQWGRDFSVAEMQGNHKHLAFPRFASMGPRLFSRGNVPKHSSE